MSDGGLNVYQTCINRQQANSTENLLNCFANVLDETRKEQMDLVARNTEVSRRLYLLYAAALVFFMQAGFAMLCAGAVRKKNLQNTMLKNLLDACGASVAFYSVGYAFAFGDGSNSNGFIGTTNFFLMNVDDLGFWVYQYTFSAASATIVAGTLAERCKMGAYFYYSALVSGFVYPVVVHAIWSHHGFLSPKREDPFMGIGVLDFAGSGVVHMTGGITALIATTVLGPRRGRFHDEQTGEPLAKPKPIKGHNMGLQLLGTLILWFGWYGFNSGSALIIGSDFDYELAALAVTNTTLSAGIAGITALFVNMIILERITGKAQYDLMLSMNGVLAGLVGITGGCGLVEPWAAVIIGFVAGLIYLGSSWLLVGLRLDDAVDAIPVHFSSGAWGLIAVGLFASPDRLEMAYGKAEHVGFFHSIFSRFHTIDATLLGAQLVGVFFIIAWCTFIMLPFFLFLDYHGLFRSDVIDELVGLDKSFHGGVQENGEDALSPDAMAHLEKRLMKTMKRNRFGGVHGEAYSASRTSTSNKDDEKIPGSIEIDRGSMIEEDDYEVPMK